MLNLNTLNIQESLKHAWHWGIGVLRSLTGEVIMLLPPEHCHYGGVFMVAEF